MVKLKNLLKEATNFDVKKILALIKKEKFHPSGVKAFEIYLRNHHKRD